MSMESALPKNAKSRHALGRCYKKCGYCKQREVDTLKRSLAKAEKREMYLRHGLVEVRDEIAILYMRPINAVGLSRKQTKDLRKTRTLAERVLDGKWEAPKE